MTHTTLVTLVTGRLTGVREAAIAAMLNERTTTHRTEESIAVIVEGMSTGTDPFAAFTDHFPHLVIARIAPGCPCCIGNLTMRVTLNRMLRHLPQTLYISLAADAHLAPIRQFLTAEPYDQLLTLAKEISV